jgi:hypothetical protein
LKEEESFYDTYAHELEICDESNNRFYFSGLYYNGKLDEIETSREPFHQKPMLSPMRDWIDVTSYSNKKWPPENNS